MCFASKADYLQELDGMSYGTMNGKRAVTLHRGMNSHNNFLAQTGHAVTNLGSTTFVIPNYYSQVVVYLVNDNITLKSEYSLYAKQESTLNMTHTVLEDASVTEGWTMSR